MHDDSDTSGDDSDTTDESYSSLYCCVRESRCRLCQFGLEKDDKVVAYIDNGQRLAYFGFDPFLTRYDPVSNIRFHTCRSGCRLGNLSATLFHTSCFEFRRRLGVSPGPVTPGFLAATAYGFEPLSREVRRRSDLIQSRLVPKLSKALPVWLPAEILVMIAKLLIRESAIVTAQQLMLSDPSPSESFVELTRNVYAQYLEIDGILYLQGLRNSVIETGGKDVLLLEARAKATIHKMWIAEDHLGIRSVLFGSASGMPGTSLGPGVWWRCISRRDGIARIKAITDTMKLRDISIPDGQSVPEAQIGWATPEHPTYVIDLGPLTRPGTLPKGVRMCYFDCNAPGTTGYSVATDGITIATIHAHKQDDDDMDFYKDVDSFQWIFMPLDEGEYLIEICRRYGRYIGTDAFGLVFTTNRGRHTMVGCYTPRPENLDLRTILTPKPVASRVWFNAWDSTPERQVRYIAFDETHPRARPVKRIFPRSLMPTVPFRGTSSNEPWQFSACSMKGVAELTICQDVSLGHKPIIGLQFRYAGGHRSCVGQFRFDMVLETIRVEGAGALYIGRGRTKQDFLYVGSIAVAPSADDGGRLTWTACHCDGKLEWWFSSRHSIIRMT